MNRRWVLSKTNPEYVAYLAGAAGVSGPMAQVLINRGIKSPDEAAMFLGRRDDRPCDPMAIGGVKAAVDIIKSCRADNTKILIHGDYDTDGLTSTAMLYEALTALEISVDYFIPNRFTDGYGFHPPVVDKAKESGARLIITVDCGITAFDACLKAKQEGIGVVITDHHEPALDAASGNPVLPDALAIINPKLTNHALSNLSGAGVVLKIIEALAVEFGPAVDPDSFIDLTALGTLADSVPLTGENRAFLRRGLLAIAQDRRPGIKALKDISRINDRPIKTGLLNFTLVPRINAAGRLSDAADVVRLLTSKETSEAESIAASLDKKNQERQKIEERTFKEAVAMIGDSEPPEAVVLYKEGWHEGVLGIVAARITEKFNRPAFILSVKDGIAKGSARSIPEFDIYQCLEGARRHLISFGGHRQAAGLKLKVDDIDGFSKTVAKSARERLGSGFLPTLHIDAAVHLSEITFGLVGELEMLEPFGFGNPEPVLGSRGLSVMNARVVGNNHLKLKLKSGSSTMDAIGFRMGHRHGEIERAQSIDAAFTAGVNEWEGGRMLQLQLKGLRTG